ncbi:TIGR04283 family arsenosugar biosynthesis glycosyltransferase [Cloacibacillus sp. An23]|uniref:TIGR04283 family arsenosugar biosynthesis glycosyltransferase n=1 Tax=Cloacibacillus sp. An23 TaxID=1965591 RepID=UPI001302B166|nr:TIGR04283 family arsenosugar biosynthesis glycosyltransferase [Cloacibacillus sp. An23]
MKSNPKLSIIIPMLNERRALPALLENLARLEGASHEVIFADGGSADGSRELAAKSGFRLADAPRGRARQMNAGAAAASGEVLLFLHADSRLPKDCEALIFSTLERENCAAGCFRLRFDMRHPLMKICAFMSTFRVKHRQIAFGDQGIFVKKTLFDKLGGFPDIPLMEDYRFSETLARETKIAVADGYIETSARRFTDGGMLRTMWKMQKIQYLYRKGVAPEELLKLYRDVR